MPKYTQTNTHTREQTRTRTLACVLTYTHTRHDLQEMLNGNAGTNFKIYIPRFRLQRAY